MNHLSIEQLSAHLDRALEGRARERVAAHLADCGQCRAALEALSAQDKALRPALEHDPGDAYFEPFAARVTERVKAGGAATAARDPERAPRTGGAAWFGSPRRMALAGTALAVIVGGSLVLLTARQSEIAPLTNLKILARSNSREVPPKAPPPAARTSREAEPTADQTPPSQAPSAATTPDATEPPAAVTPPAAEPPVGTKQLHENAIPETPAESPQDHAAPAPRSDRLAARERAKRDAAVAPSAPPAAIQQELAKPGRAYEVRRDPVTGEEVRVQPGSGFARPPVVSAPAPSPASSGPVRVLKGGQVAQPMGAAPAAPTPAREETPRASAAGAAPENQAVKLTDQKPGAVAALDETQSTGGLLCGMVRDPDGQSIAGAQVIVADNGNSTRSDARGHFCIRAPAGRRTLSIMALGYQPSRQQVTFTESTTELALTLQPVAVLETGRAGLLRAVDSLSRRIGMGSRGGITGTPGSEAPTLSPGAPGVYSYMSETLPKIRQEPRSDAGDVFDALPDTLRAIARDAERASVAAARRRSADQYEVAAWGWERLLQQVKGGPAEHETRFRLGEARFHAWEESPSKRRASAAIEALTAFIVRAPGGAQRTQATRWLDRVK